MSCANQVAHRVNEEKGTAKKRLSITRKEIQRIQEATREPADPNYSNYLFKKIEWFKEKKKS